MILYNFLNILISFLFSITKYIVFDQFNVMLKCKVLKLKLIHFNYANNLLMLEL